MGEKGTSQRHDHLADSEWFCFWMARRGKLEGQIQIQWKTSICKPWVVRLYVEENYASLCFNQNVKILFNLWFILSRKIRFIWNKVSCVKPLPKYIFYNKQHKRALFALTVLVIRYWSVLIHLLIVRIASKWSCKRLCPFLNASKLDKAQRTETQLSLCYSTIASNFAGWLRLKWA